MRVQITGDQQVRRALRDRAVVRRPTRRLLERASQTVEGRAKGNAPVDTGRLRSSITRSINVNRGQARVGSPLVYAPVMEFGLRPGTFPPPSALQPWARRHGFPPGEAGAFLVARAIFRRGIQAQPYLIPALEDSQGDIRRFLGIFLDEVVQEFRRRGGV